CTLGGQIAAQTTIGNWFVQKRGLAMGITMGIGGAVSFFIPLLVDGALGVEGDWRRGFYLISIFALIALVIVIVFIKDKPSDVGQYPDGIDPNASVDKGAPEDNPRLRVYRTRNPKTSSQAVCSLPFWLIMLCSFSIFFALNMDISAGVLNFTGLGINQSTIALGLSLQSVAMVVVNIAIAFLADRIEPARLLGVSALLTGLGALFALICTPGNTIMMFAYYFLLGIGFGSNMSVMPTALANYFGMEHYPKIIGVALPVLSIFSGFVPIVAGAVFESVGTYVPLYVG
ncbi:MAG: MFS transporter, partial [Bacteroides sp.]